MESRKRFLCNSLHRDDFLNYLKNETSEVKFKFKYLEKDQFVLSLIDKVIENASDAFNNQNNDENLKKYICDLLDALDSFINILVFSKEEIYAAKELKIKKRGSFDDGLFIYSIEMNNEPGNKLFDNFFSSPEKYQIELVDEKSERVRFLFSKTGKLVRNNSIINLPNESIGARYNYKMLSKPDHIIALLKKLQEEAIELFEEREDKNELKNEIADVLEVVEAICKLKNFSSTKIKEFGDKKRNEFGSFNKGLFIEWFEVPIGTRMYEYALLQTEKYKAVDNLNL